LQHTATFYNILLEQILKDVLLLCGERKLKREFSGILRKLFLEFAEFLGKSLQEFSKILEQILEGLLLFC